MSKLRILCLHGFSSNGPVHAHQVRHLISQLSSTHEFIFPSGPHEVDVIRSLGDNASTTAWSKYVSSLPGPGHRAWWFAVDPSSSSPSAGTFRGLEASFEALGAVMRKEGEIHGIWGFSQGACLTGMLLGLLSEQNRNHEFRKRYLPDSQGMPMAGVIFSGFKARFEQYDGLYGDGIEVPTLHVVGEKDFVVSGERSEALMGVCSKKEILRHEGAHDIPGKEEDQGVIVKFLKDNVKQRRIESL